jgi:hypothetical protein
LVLEIESRASSLLGKPSTAGVMPPAIMLCEIEYG